MVSRKPGIKILAARVANTSSKGFTLVEILIAMFIFAIILSTIYTSYTGTFRIVDETESQANIYRMARIALDRISEDLASAYMPKEADKLKTGDSDEPRYVFAGEDKEIEGRSADSLRFISRAHIVFGEQDRVSATAEISYYVEENDEGDSFILYRTDRPDFESMDEEATGGLIVCEGLYSASFTYYDSEGEANENWDSTSDELKGKIPQTVSILLEFVNTSDPEKPFKFMTSVALPMGQE